MIPIPDTRPNAILKEYHRKQVMVSIWQRDRRINPSSWLVKHYHSDKSRDHLSSPSTHLLS